MSVCGYTGEGRFGKVYECLNLTSGEMHAVKQVSYTSCTSTSQQCQLSPSDISSRERLKHCADHSRRNYHLPRTKT